MSSQSNKRFRVALSFAGEDREYVEQIAVLLSAELGKDRVFYDLFHESELYGQDLDQYLLNIYRQHSDLIVVFISPKYEKSTSSGLEWRAIRELIKTRQPDDVMLVQLASSYLPGLFPVDGYINAERRSPDYIASLIIQRLKISHPLDVEIKLIGSLDQFTAEKEQELLEAIRSFLGTDYNIKIKDVKEGSVKITIELETEDAVELFTGFQKKSLRIEDLLSVAIRANVRESRDISPDNSDSFDVFLCHNSEDKPEIKRMANLLRARGLNPWLDEEQLRPGMPWQQALEDNIGSIRAAAVCIGQGGLGPWQNVELQAFLTEFVRRNVPVIPVILETATQEPRLPLFLRTVTWVDFRKSTPDPVDMLVYGITGNRAQDQ